MAIRAMGNLDECEGVKLVTNREKMGKKDGLVRQRGKEKMYQNCLERYTNRY